MKFRKRILKVGTYHSPDGQVVVTPNRIQHWQEQFRAMRNKQLAIPIGWDHHDDPNLSKPVRLGQKRSAKDVVGYVTDIRSVDSGASMEIEVDLPRSEDADKVRHNLAYVSPVIFNSWTDGRGETHQDCITRIDLVQHPVDNSQGAFEPIPQAIACAIRMGLDTGKPQTFSLGTLMDDELLDLESDDMGEEGAAESVDSTDRVANVIAALAGMSIILPEDTTADNFFERVEAALLTAAAIEQGDSVDVESLDETAPDGFAQMGLGKRLTPLEKKLLGQAVNANKQNIRTRLSALLESGRCTPAEFREQSEAVNSIRLSLDATGELRPNAVEGWIKSRAAIPKGTFWSNKPATRLSTVSRNMGPVSEEEAEELVNGLFGKK